MNKSMPSSIASSLKPGLIAYGVVCGALFVYNVRWRFAANLIFGAKPKTLPILKESPDDDKKKKKPIIVLLHGMWHDAVWYSKLQKMLKEKGYYSYAIELLPGERALPGFSQQEIVQDLEATLLDNEEYILLGHSQGGLVAQSVLKNSPKLEAKTKATVLLGTYPLGLMPPAKKLFSQQRNMYNHIGYAGICLIGKVISLDYLKHIFLSPSTDVHKEELKEYTKKILSAPSDGRITMSHFPQSVGLLSTKPALVLGAKDDIIYPPHMLKKDFDERFPNATHKVIPNQGHCFMDGGTEMEEALIAWLDTITD